MYGAGAVDVKENIADPRGFDKQYILKYQR